VTHLFSIATRDELWSGGVLIESRLSHGEARCRGNEIDATDRADRVLIDRAEALIESMRAAAREHADARVRLVASARRVNDFEREEQTIAITKDGVSVLNSSPSPRPAGSVARGEGHVHVPLAWQNGSAAVLLHEAAGHPAEHHHASLQWPAWLTIRDEPDFVIDDAGDETRSVDLTRESPATLRRESFRDIPLPRMTRLIARQHDAPFAMPGERIDVHLVAGGAYEPLTGLVTISVAVADLVNGDDVTPLAPFQIRVPRERVARALLGATGDPVRYPGVVCSREGQEVVVGSFAPLIVTEAL